MKLDTNEWNAAERYTRTAPKPIRWRIPDDHMQHFTEDLRTQLDAWTPQYGLGETTTMMQRLLRWGRRTPKAHIQARTPRAEQRLRQELRQATTDETIRSTRTRLQHAADRIRREKGVPQGTYVLQHLRDGGWGAKDVAQTMETAAQQRASDPKTIADRATKYNGDLFQNPREDDTHITGLISRRSNDWHNDRVVITQEDVRTAI